MKSYGTEALSMAIELFHKLGLDAGIKTMLSIITTLASTIFLSIADLIPFLYILMICDFIFGVWRAIKEGRVSGVGFRKGFYKIILYMFGITVTCTFAVIMKKTIGTSLFIDVFIVTYLGAHETISTLSHLGKLGFPVPKWLVDKLQTFHADPYGFVASIANPPAEPEKKTIHEPN